MTPLSNTVFHDLSQGSLHFVLLGSPPHNYTEMAKRLLVEWNFFMRNFSVANKARHTFGLFLAYFCSGKFGLWYN